MDPLRGSLCQTRKGCAKLRTGRPWLLRLWGEHVALGAPLPGGSSGTDPGEDEILAELQSVLRSSAFERAPKLQRFLRFVADLTLRGEAERIHEYLIAQEVFDRGADYSPGEDSIVRRQAHALRSKLERFYATEGLAHSTVIELPVGRYVPVFRRRSVASPESAASTVRAPETADAAAPSPHAADPQSSPRTSRLLARRVLQAGLVFAAGLAAGWLVRPMPAPVPRSAVRVEVDEVWGPWLRSERGAVLCFTNRMAASLRHEVDNAPQVTGGWDVAESSAGAAMFRRFFALPPGGRLNVFPERVMVKVGDARAGARLSLFFGQHGVAVRTLESRHLTWETLRRENVVLIGQSDGHHSGVNNWVKLLLERYPLGVAAPDRAQGRRIVNRSPLPGERTSFERTETEEPGREVEMVTLISMLPGVAPGREIVLLNGIDAPATDMAAEYLTNPDTLSDLTARLRAAAPGSRPRHFQAVLRAEVHEDVPTRAEILAIRTF